MFQRKWPVTLTPATEPLFIRVVLGIFLVLFILDAPVTVAVDGLPDWVRAPFYYITRLGKSDWILIPSFLVAVGGFILGRFLWRDERAKLALKTASISAFVFCGTAIPGILANLLKRTFGRARPVRFEELGIWHFEPINFHWTMQSFPSGDATTIFAFAATIAFFFPRWAALAVLGAALVALSRIMIGVHYPTDVFGGILLGTYGAYAVRNFCLQRGWLFAERDNGQIVAN